MNHNDFEFPSLYDFFYINSSIISLLDPISVSKYFSNNNINTLGILRGYCYLFEFLVLDLIHNLESLLKDQELSEIVQWGHVDITHPTIKKLSSSDFFLSTIYQLNKLRSQLSKIRFKQCLLEENDKEKIFCVVNSVITISNNVDKHLHSVYRIKPKIKDKHTIQLRKLSYVISKLNYIEGDIDFFKKNNKVICAFPMNPSSSLLPSSFRKSYYLQNPLIKDYNDEYFFGYKKTIIYLYIQLINSNKTEVISRIDQSMDWHSFHMLGSKIGEKYTKEHRISLRFFDMVSSEECSKLPQKIINTNQLNRIFRRINNLDVKIFKDRHRGDYPNSHAFFKYIIEGGLSINKNRLEVLEFERIKGDDHFFSYAIYIPVNGFFWSSSHWLFFEDLTVTNSWEPFSDVKMFVEAIYENFGINLKRFKVSGELLKNYVYQKDFYKQFTKNQEEKLVKSKGLLGEAISYYYLAKKFNATLIDFHRDIKNTDIDVLAKNKDTYFLVQSKKTFPFLDTEIKEIISHFKLVEDRLGISSTKRFLFVIGDYVSDEDSFAYMDSKGKDGLSIIESENRCETLKKRLIKENVEVITYHQVKKELISRDSKHFFGEIDVIFDDLLPS